MAIYVDEKELIAAYHAGDTGAFTELVNEYGPELVRHARRRLRCETSAEDALQETLMRAYKALPKFAGEYRLGPWLHRIMANVCLDELRKRQRESSKTDRFASLSNVDTDYPSVEQELGLEINVDELNLLNAVDELPAQYREALVMRFVDEMEYSEVALTAGISEQNARARVSRARNAMRSVLKGVAIFPGFLWAVFHRGEKAVSAATVNLNGVSNIGTQTAQLTASSLPTAVEAVTFAATSAPIVVPVLAKAAVGIGLVAAILTPTSDSAFNQVVDDFSFSGTTFISQEVDDQTSVSEVMVIDTLSEPKSVEVTSSQLVDEKILSEPIDADGSFSQVPTALNSTIEPAKVTMSIAALQLAKAGPNRFDVQGNIDISIDGNQRSGSLESMSTLMFVSDGDSNERLEGLLVFMLDDESIIELRLAGIASGSPESVKRVVGLFRAEPNDVNIALQGSFEGSLVIDVEALESSMSLALNP